MSESPAGAPPFKGHRAAYRELLETLWYASNKFENEGDGGLEGAKLACRAVARFIGVRHEDPRLAAPFLTIMLSFIDLERGLDQPLFSKNVKLRERERSSQRKHLQMLAVVAMEVLLKLGARTDPRNPQFQQLCDHILRLGDPGGRGEKAARSSARGARLLEISPLFLGAGRASLRSELNGD
jgi:hypothetical protein